MPDISSQNDNSVGDAPVINAAELQKILPARYSILKIVGFGGAGVVYKAQDSTLRKVVAIKTLHRSTSPNVAIRFQREAQLAGSLNHPNVMRVLDFGVTGENDPYLVLDYVKGESLAQRLERKGALPVAEALDLFMQIAAGLSHAHNRSIIHRDIKPSNVMLVKKDKKIVAQIADFGLAKSRDEQQALTAPGTGVGTPTYMSPEQIRGGTIDHRSDIYSFGCLMFHVLTGQPPFQGRTTLDTINMHLNDTPKGLNEVDAGKFTESLDAIVQNCLEKNPDDRFSSLEEIASLLQDEGALADYSGVDGEPQAAHDQRPSKSRMKGRDLLILTAVSATLLGLFAILAWVSIQNDEPVTVGRHNDLDFFKAGDSTPFAFKKDQWRAETDANDRSLEAWVRTLDPKEKFKLDLSVSEVTPAGLETLNRTSIEVLIYRLKAINHRTLRHVSKLRSLKNLELGDTDEVDPGAFLELSTMRLRGLGVNQSPINQQVLNNISTIKTLEWIDLAGATGVAGLDWSCLRALKNLHEINLNKTDVDVETIKRLTCLETIQRVDLKSTKVNDDCLATLATIKSLQTVNLLITDSYTLEGCAPLLRRKLQLLEETENHKFIDRRPKSEVKSAKAKAKSK